MIDHLFKSITSYARLHQLMEPSHIIIVGLSGGPDSLFLLHYFAHARKAGLIKEVIGAHLDHQWRENSASDVLFCKEACESLAIEFVSSTLSELDFSRKNEGSKEEIGRRARRFFLESVLHQKKADSIALAHHLQDQEETFFIRLVRGSSLTGLISIRPKHGVYIRPLLETSKDDLIRFLDAHAIPYLTDPTNVHFDYLRNRIRATVLPALQEVDERFNHNFLITLNRLRQTEEYLESVTEETYERISTQENGSSILDVATFLGLPPVLRYRVLMQWMIKEQVPFSPSQSFLDEIIRFLYTSESKEHTLHETWKIVKKKNKAQIKIINAPLVSKN